MMGGGWVDGGWMEDGWMVDKWMDGWTNNGTVDIKYSALLFLLGHALIAKLNPDHCI